MSVSLDPSSQLSFRKPFTSLVKQNLKVYNYNSQPVAFKVKTTAPKLYCVRPNAGRIEPGEAVDVSVLLQPMKEDPPLSFKCKDKFLVQSTIITPEKENLSSNDLWTSNPGDESSRVHQQKLKVVYLPAQGTLPEEDEGDQAHQSSMISENDSGLRHYDTVRQHPGSNGHSLGDNLTGIPVFDNPPRAHTPDQADYLHAHEDAHDAHDSAPEPIPSPATSPMKASYNANVGVGSVSANPMVSYDHTAEYAAKLAEANAEISRLQALLANSNTMASRRRTVFSDDGTSVQDAMTDGGLDDGASVIGTAVRPDGVPLNVVAILSVLVFVVTYLFF